MPYIRIWISDEERASLLALAQAQEDDAARLDRRPAARITVAEAGRGCFVEGLLDMQARQPTEPDDEEDEDGE